MVECPDCQTANPDTAKFCGVCGYRLRTLTLLIDAPGWWPCPFCAAEVRAGDTFCLNCGQSLLIQSSQTIDTVTSFSKAGYRPPSSSQIGPSHWGTPGSLTLFPPVNAGIKCPKCSYINRDTARFCGVCGISLTSFRSLSEGTIIGSYVIVKRLGVGGIGAVYLSRHRILEHLVVAIKIHDYFPEDKQVGIAFKQSANYLSQMRHSSIVQLLDYGFQNDHAYQAMEYIEGPTFASLVPDQPTKGWLNQCLEYFAQLLSALYHAHNCRYLDLDGQYKKGIIHGDIKPHNIFLNRVTDTAKLADFMIPDVQNFLGEENHHFDMISTDALGTPKYMAPEQRKGELTQQSDIYSMGATMYELVTGHSPEDARRDISPKSINPYVPDWLDEMIIKSMKFYPPDRFQTVGEMIRIFNENCKAEKASWVLQAKEIFMGDQVHNKIGDISNSGQIFIGKFNDVVANLNASGQNELASALKALQEAVMASQQLPQDKKEELVESINQVGEEAAKSKPNKTLLKMLGDGLIAALKAIPDVAPAIANIAPLLE